MIEIINFTKFKIFLPEIRKNVKKILKILKIKKDISIVFTDSAKIKNINKEYRGIDKVTDILSFSGERNNLGEIIISLPQVKKQARENRNTFKKELFLLLIHGLLHLQGFVHHKSREKKIMRNKENKISQILSL